MSIHVLKPSAENDPVQQAKIDLAAAHRLAALHELEEGIDNHFTVTVPGYDDRYLILPFGFHWSEARASDMLQFDESGATVAGRGDCRDVRGVYTRAGAPHHRCESCAAYPPDLGHRVEHAGEQSTHFREPDISLFSRQHCLRRHLHRRGRYFG